MNDYSPESSPKEIAAFPASSDGHAQQALRLPRWALELAAHVVLLRAQKKHCTILIRFNGLVWQILEARPVSEVIVGE